MYKFTYYASKGSLVFFHSNGKIHKVTLPGQTIKTYYKFVERKLPGLKAKLDLYFKGSRVVFDTPLLLEGLPFFTKEVLLTVKELDWGELVTYKELSMLVTGDVKAARAVGQALKKNPLPILTPCHRVIKENGGPGGFSGGRDLKTWLLSLEGWRTQGKQVKTYDTQVP